ncbi:MAG: hypothetical protein LAT82_02630 [Nanoarchaeota archaeon]|nr:hypothetical protein [Nanoarchaeota archaeon]
MITKSSIQYFPLINLDVKIVTQNLEIIGVIVFESQQVLEVKIENSETIKNILKSSIIKLYVYDTQKNKYVEISCELIRGDLVYRLKKMK